MTEQIITAREINKAYGELEVAKDLYQWNGKKLITATIAYKVARAELLAAGVEGSNQKKRDATLEIALSDLKTTEDRLIEESADARLSLDLAQIEVNRCKLLVRLLEIEAKN